MRTVLITGSAGGIGSALVEKFQSEGWEVFGVDIKTNIDIGDKTAVSKIINYFLENGWDRLDALINNAAIQINKPLLETTTKDWHDVMRVNVWAPFYISQQFQPWLKNGGSIVNIASVHAMATLPNRGAYPTSKAGLVALTRSMALEWADDGIRANCIAPGAIDTDLLRENTARRAPAGRIGRPDEVANLVYFLADSAQSDFITGRTFVIDGGVLACLSSEAGRECGKGEN